MCVHHPWEEATRYHRGVSLVKDESGLSYGDVMGVMSENNPVGFVNTAGEMVILYRFDRTLLGWGGYSDMRNATIRGNRVIVWYRGKLTIFAADGTQIY